MKIINIIVPDITKGLCHKIDIYFVQYSFTPWNSYFCFGAQAFHNESYSEQHLEQDILVYVREKKC